MGENGQLPEIIVTQQKPPSTIIRTAMVASTTAEEINNRQQTRYDDYGSDDELENEDLNSFDGGIYILLTQYFLICIGKKLQK